MNTLLTKLEEKIVAAFSVGQERAKEFIFSCHAAVVAHKFTVVDMLAVLYVWGLRDMVGVVMEHERKKMRGNDYDLTDEQHTKVFETLPKIADLALLYLVSGYPVDSYFDVWAGMMIGAGDTSSWGDDALGCALVDVGEKYEKFVRAMGTRDLSPNSRAAQVRGALLHAGSLLVSVNNRLIAEEVVNETITVALEKFEVARAMFTELGCTIPE